MASSISLIATFLLAASLNYSLFEKYNFNNQAIMVQKKKTELKFSLKIKAEANTIFKAITTKKGYQGWWAKVCDVDCKISGVSSIRFEKPNITEEMLFTTTDITQDKMLVWQCTANNVFHSWVGTTLTFEIIQEKGYCTFVFTQVNSDPNWKTNADYSGSKAGWDFFFQSLKEYCETGKGEPWG